MKFKRVARPLAHGPTCIFTLRSFVKSEYHGCCRIVRGGGGGGLRGHL